MPKKSIDVLDSFITTIEKPDKKPDEKTALEAEDLETEKKQFDLVREKSEHKDRQEYAKKIFTLILWWLVTIIFLVFLDSINEINIDNSVLIALIGGTTITVVSIFHFVLKYLYRYPKPKQDWMS